MRTASEQERPALDQPAFPAIPLRLADRPLVGGLAAPWISVHHADGTPVLGVVDAARQALCLARRWCQVCGQPLVSPLVLLARPRDIAAGYVSEPGLHPECAAYSAAACPMLSGTMRRYRATPRPARQERCSDPLCLCWAWVSPADSVHRSGHEREAFAAVWIELADYHLTGDLQAGKPAGIRLTGIRILKVRSLSSSPGRNPAGIVR